MTASHKYPVVSTQYSVPGSPYSLLGLLALIVPLFACSPLRAADYEQKQDGAILRIQIGRAHV